MSDALREQLGGRAPLDFLAGFLGDPEAESRAHLPEAAAARAFAEGRALSVDAALATATGPPGRRPGLRWPSDNEVEREDSHASEPGS